MRRWLRKHRLQSSASGRAQLPELVVHFPPAALRGVGTYLRRQCTQGAELQDKLIRDCCSSRLCFPPRAAVGPALAVEKGF